MIIGIIVYTFRDSAGPILEQLKKTTPAVITGICVMTVVYHVIEGTITALLAKQYNPDFTVGMGITNAFFCSFYRVATLGSGAGVAAIVYLGEHSVEYSKSFGLYMLQYAFHKISIALFSMLMFVLNWNYMYSNFSDYMWLLLADFLWGWQNAVHELLANLLPNSAACIGTTVITFVSGLISFK